jgi:hypothetical protein
MLSVESLAFKKTSIRRAFVLNRHPAIVSTSFSLPCIGFQFELQVRQQDYDGASMIVSRQHRFSELPSYYHARATKVHLITPLTRYTSSLQLFPLIQDFPWKLLFKLFGLRTFETLRARPFSLMANLLLHHSASRPGDGTRCFLVSRSIQY